MGVYEEEEPEEKIISKKQIIRGKEPTEEVKEEKPQEPKIEEIKEEEIIYKITLSGTKRNPQNKKNKKEKNN